MKRTVGIVDYRMGNFQSVVNACESLDAEVFRVKTPSDAKKCKHIILPGVGAFQTGMAHLREQDLVEALRTHALEDCRPLLGICIGMQLLADRGFEGGEEKGLGLISGEVRKLTTDTLHIPHIGWNAVEMKRSAPYFSLSSPEDFYFVHSYAFEVRDEKNICGTTMYGEEFTSVVARDNILGTQFHPEKSQYHGLQLLEHFLDFEC